MYFFFLYHFIYCNSLLQSSLYKIERIQHKCIEKKKIFTNKIQSFTNITIDNCIFNLLGRYNNLGGALYIKNQHSTNFISNSQFTNCFSQFGGSIYIYSFPDSKTIFEYCYFQKNFAEKRGGAIFHSNTNVFFHNCEFLDNFINSNEEKQNIYYYYSSGGAVVSYYSNEVFNECNFTDNFAQFGEDIFFHFFSNDYKLSINNCLFEKKENKRSKLGVMIIFNGFQSNPEYIFNFNNNQVVFSENFHYTLFVSLFDLKNHEKINIINNCIFPYHDEYSLSNIYQDVNNNFRFSDVFEESCLIKKKLKPRHNMQILGIEDSSLNIINKNFYSWHIMSTPSYIFTPSNLFTPSCIFTASLSFTLIRTQTSSCSYLPSNTYIPYPSSYSYLPSNTIDITKSLTFSKTHNPIFSNKTSIIIIISCIVIIIISAIFIIVLIIKWHESQNREFLNILDNSSIHQISEDLNAGL